MKKKSKTSTAAVKPVAKKATEAKKTATTKRISKSALAPNILQNMTEEELDKYTYEQFGGKKPISAAEFFSKLKLKKNK